MTKPGRTGQPQQPPCCGCPPFLYRVTACRPCRVRLRLCTCVAEGRCGRGGVEEEVAALCVTHARTPRQQRQPQHTPRMKKREHTHQQWRRSDSGTFSFTRTCTVVLLRERNGTAGLPRAHPPSSPPPSRCGGKQNRRKVRRWAMSEYAARRSVSGEGGRGGIVLGGKREGEVEKSVEKKTSKHVSEDKKVAARCRRVSRTAWLSSPPSLPLSLSPLPTSPRACESSSRRLLPGGAPPRRRPHQTPLSALSGRRRALEAEGEGRCGAQVRAAPGPFQHKRRTEGEGGASGDRRAGKEGKGGRGRRRPGHEKKREGGRSRSGHVPTLTHAHTHTLGSEQIQDAEKREEKGRTMGSTATHHRQRQRRRSESYWVRKEERAKRCAESGGWGGGRRGVAGAERGTGTEDISR